MSWIWRILWVVEEHDATWVVTDRFRCMSCPWHPGWRFLLLGHTHSSGVCPRDVYSHVPARSKTYLNSSLLHRVTERRLDSSDMTPSNTSILCRSVLSHRSQFASLLFHRRRSMSSSLSSRTSSLSFWFSSLPFCARISFSFLISCCSLRMAWSDESSIWCVA